MRAAAIVEARLSDEQRRHGAAGASPLGVQRPANRGPKVSPDAGAEGCLKQQPDAPTTLWRRQPCALRRWSVCIWRYPLGYTWTTHISSSPVTHDFYKCQHFFYSVWTACWNLNSAPVYTHTHTHTSDVSPSTVSKMNNLTFTPTMIGGCEALILLLPHF